MNIWIKFLFVACFMISTTAATSANETLRVLVVHPKALANDYGGGLYGRIDNAIAWTNKAYQNSGANIRLSLVGVAELNIKRGDKVSEKLLESMEYSRDLMDLRDKYRPDLTVYMTYKSSSLCGIAYFPEPGERKRFNYYRIREMAFKGISVVAINCDFAVFAHEIGHNLGANHGRKQGDNGFPIRSNRGWAVENEFSTIMPYYWQFGVSRRLQYFSNPSVKECRGMACGTSQDNAADGMTKIANDYVKMYSSCYPTRRNNLKMHHTKCGQHICLKRNFKRRCIEWE